MSNFATNSGWKSLTQPEYKEGEEVSAAAQTAELELLKTFPEKYSPNYFPGKKGQTIGITIMDTTRQTKISPPPALT